MTVTFTIKKASAGLFKTAKKFLPSSSLTEAAASVKFVEEKNVCLILMGNFLMMLELFIDLSATVTVRTRMVRF